MEKYTLDLEPHEREALYSAMCETAHFNRDLLRQLSATNREAKIEIEGHELTTLLRALDLAIERQEQDSGCWVRAREYRDAKGTLVSKTRNNFKVVHNGQ